MRVIVVRPKKDKKDKATERIHLRVTESQDSNYARIAEEKGLKSAAWIKKVLDREVLKEDKEKGE